MRGGWTYMMTNRPHGVLYFGVTANLSARVAQHRDGTGSDFCRRYRLTRLVLAEPHGTIEEAIAREKMVKAWKQAWKIELVENPTRNGATCGTRSTPDTSVIPAPDQIMTYDLSMWSTPDASVIPAKAGISLLRTLK